MAVLQALAKRLTFLVDDVAPSDTGLVILAYHRVGGRTASPVDLSTEQFTRQMAHLADETAVVSLDDALDILAGDDPLTEPNTVLTFDDGTADFVDVVLPILVEHQLPAVLYLATSNIDEQRPFPLDGAPLSWDAVRECVSTGLVSVGAHTHSHALLDRCDPLTVDLELDVCNDRIASETGIKPSHFAYPKAIGGNRYANGAVRLRYRSAAVAGTRPNLVGATDQWKLHRSPIQNADQWEGFVRKAGGGMRVEDDVRRVVNTVRYRGRTS